MKIQLAGIVNDSIVDGPGFRLAVFTQGCPHKCYGCHNPQTHDFSSGKPGETADIVAKIRQNPLLDGVTLTGGEPFCQAEACAEIARAAHAVGLNVWSYSGYTFEELLKGNDPAWIVLLRELDVLVDGRFVMEKRTLDLRFRGSSNQRLIDVPASLKSGKAIEIDG